MKILSILEAQNLVDWMQKNAQNNWGGWSNYPTLPVTATYLQYDTQKCQVNFKSTILVKNEEVNCIVWDRHTVGAKWDKPMMYSSLREFAYPELVKKELQAYLKEKEIAKQDAFKKIELLPLDLRLSLLDIYKLNIGGKKRKALIHHAINENLEIINSIFGGFKGCRETLDIVYYSKN